MWILNKFTATPCAIEPVGFLSRRSRNHRARMRAESAVKMNNDNFYKNYLIRGESFQREEHGVWVPQYTVVRQDAAGESKEFPSHQYQFNHAYGTQSEADEFAVKTAQDWIDTKLTTQC